MHKYDVTMGIEIHLELNTQTKMFSSTPIHFQATPNTFVNEIDLGYPGNLPTVNRQAVMKALMLAKALSMQIDNVLRFDRKNYFYPDLPKGFQITQQFHPLGQNGFLPINDDNKTFKVIIERIHLEEDTAKSVHVDDLTLLDYNRSGNPLIEIVTKPCLKNSEQVAKYVSELRLVALALDISSAKMEEGSMRVDVNLSLKPWGDKNLGTKVEIKNLNSINNITKAIEYEIILQSQALDQGYEIMQATKRWDEKTQQTVVMRAKSATIDYKYFPEPNLLPIALDKRMIDEITCNELPWAKRVRYQAGNVPEEFIEQLVNSHDKSAFFDEVVKNSVHDEAHSFFAKVFFSEVVSLANRDNKLVAELAIDALQLAKACDLVLQDVISLQQLKLIIHNLIGKKEDTATIIKRLNLKQINDKEQLNAIIIEIIEQNKDFIAKNHHRSDRVAKFILGKVMQQTHGQANMQIANDIMKKLLTGI